MNHESAAPNRQQPVRFERTYDGPVDDLWDLWTTKDGFESWWGPEGFRVEVHELDLRVGGALTYDMIADSAEMIAAMRRDGMPLSHPTRGTFTEVQAPRRLTVRYLIDFIPGVPSYENHIGLELVVQGSQVRMIVEIQPHRDPLWPKRATAGFTSQLEKLPAALAAWRSA